MASGRPSSISTAAADLAVFLVVWWSWLLIGAGAAAAAWWLWWRLPKRQAARLGLTDPLARANAEDGFRRTISQLFGGATVLVGAAWAYLQFYQQQQASDKHFEAEQQASREVFISNQVAKGFELLGSENMEKKLGGIFALEGVMNTSKQYYHSVLEALCAFVRDHTKTDMDNSPPATDVQAALTVIGRRGGANSNWGDGAGSERYTRSEGRTVESSA